MSDRKMIFVGGPYDGQVRNIPAYDPFTIPLMPPEHQEGTGWNYTPTRCVVAKFAGPSICNCADCRQKRGDVVYEQDIG